jgi:SAM-dependent methyltransferase
LAVESALMFGVHIPELQLSDSDITAALDAVQMTSGERFVELGCGEGRALVAAAKRGATAVGIDYLPDALDKARQRAEHAGVDVELVRGDLEMYDLSAADIVLMHLGPAFHDRLASKLERELQSHARVVACGWGVPGWLECDQSRHWDGGWIYRPADADNFVRWHAYDGTTAVFDGSGITRESGSAIIVDVVGVTAHVGVAPIELHLSGELAAHLDVTPMPTAIGRGQTLVLELHWDIPSIDRSMDGALNVLSGSGDRIASLELRFLG